MLNRPVHENIYKTPTLQGTVRGYAWSSHIARVWINRVRLPILLVVSRTGKMNSSLSPFAPENLVSRDGFGSPVPRQPAHLHTQAESGAYLWDSSRVPRRRPFIYYERSELLIDDDGEKSTQKNVRRHKKSIRRRPPKLQSLANHICAITCRRQWGPPSLHRSFRRVTASTVHAAVGSV